MSDFNEELDARGLHCPMPILRAKKALNGMESSQILKILATDPSTIKDFEAFCKQTGHELLSSETIESETGDKEFMFLIKKV